MTHSSAHANRNAGSRPNDSRTNTYTPPERGNAAASSEYVSAPHSTTIAPTTQARRNNGTSSMRCATLAGVRKMPLPIVEPTSTATALHRPSRRISRSPQRSAGIKGADIGSRIYGSLTDTRLTPAIPAAYSGEGKVRMDGGPMIRNRVTLLVLGSL